MLWLISALIAFSVPTVSAEPVRVGDIEINPNDFSAELNPSDRVAKCLACHGERAGGDIDFGPDVHFGTPALRGMRENYLRESLLAYRDGSRRHEEMSAVAAMLDDETIDFMARTFAAFETPPMRSADEIAALAEKDLQFRRGQTITQQGIPEKGVAPCMACHGPQGEGSDTGPRLAGQNLKYIKRQFEAFAGSTRQTIEAAVMLPAASGLNAEDIEAVAHYYESVQKL
jgi:cytochrome c553